MSVVAMIYLFGTLLLVACIFYIIIPMFKAWGSPPQTKIEHTFDEVFVQNVRVLRTLASPQDRVELAAVLATEMKGEFPDTRLSEYDLEELLLAAARKQV